MKTITFMFRCDDAALKAIADDNRVCSAMRRTAYNRLLEHMPKTEVKRSLRNAAHT
jgi:hypothetical protein